MLLRCFVGSGNTAHRIKKAYIGDQNGKAQIMYNPILENTAGLFKEGNISSLGTARCDMGSGYVGNYALFVGGRKYYNDTVCSNIAEYYTSSLSRNTTSSISEYKYDMGSASVGNYVIFMGGYGPISNSHINSSKSETYNSSLIHNTLNYGLPTNFPAGTSIGDYALFAGSRSNKNAIAINSSLTSSTVSNLFSIGKEYVGATSIGNYAIFAGGEYTHYSSLYNYSNLADACSSNLVCTSLTNINRARCNIRGAHIGDYALLGGGYIGSSNGPGYTYDCDIYNSSLVHSLTSIQIAVSDIATVSLNNYAIFAGGSNSSGSSSNVVAFNSSLTASNPTSLSTARTVRGAKAGKYAIFAGGIANVNDSYDSALNTVDCYLDRAASYS